MKSTPKWLILSLLLCSCATRPAGPAADGEGQVAAAGEPAGAEPGQEQLQPTDADAMYHVFAGEVLGAEGDMRSAADEYLEAAMESDDPEVAARATRIALAAQAWQHAAMASDRWVLLQPDNIEARQTAARAMIVVGDYVGAEHHLGGILAQLRHDRGQAWAMVAGLLSTSGNPDRSGQVLERLIEENQAGDDPDALYARSQFLAARRQLAEAAELAARILRLAPERAEFHAWAGRLAVNLGQESEARSHYRDAWELDVSNQRIAMAYAELLSRNGEGERIQEVLSALEDAPAIRLARVAFALEAGLDELAVEIYQGFQDANYPDPLEHAFQAAQAAELLERRAEATQWYSRVTSGERMLVSALRRAYLTAEAGDLAEARNQLSSLRLQHDSDIVRESFLAESEILLNADLPGDAFDLLSGALEVIPGDSQLLYGRAMVAVQLDRLSEAESDLRRIIEQDPQNAAALNALGYTLADRMERYEEAEQLIRAAFELQPEEASIIDSMGWVAFRLGRFEEAETYLREALQRDDNAEIAAHLGEVLWALERRTEAVEVWQEALESDPDNAVLNETMARFGVGP